MSTGEIVLYQTEDGLTQISLRAVSGTVWLTQKEMAQLFDVSTDNISLHLKNLYQEGQLSKLATTEDSSVVQKEGLRDVQRTIKLYYHVSLPQVNARFFASCTFSEF